MVRPWSSGDDLERSEAKKKDSIFKLISLQVWSHLMWHVVNKMMVLAAPDLYTLLL